MRSLRYNIEIKEGVTADMLFTPHLYSFKGTSGITFETDAREVGSLLEVYADIMYCAGLNAWVLDGKGSPEDYPFTRGDFHEFMTTCPKEYGKALNFALEALTGKSYGQIVKEAKEAEKTTKEQNEQPAESKKKVSAWIGRLLRRSS